LPRPLSHQKKHQIMTMKLSKDLEFPVVTLPSVGHMPAAGEDEQVVAQVFYVAATRAAVLNFKR
jgi:superfamily I DNA/RNA helicase